MLFNLSSMISLKCLKLSFGVFILVTCEPRNLCGFSCVVCMCTFDLLSFGSVRTKDTFLTLPDTIDRDLHFPGLNINPMVLALFSMSVRSCWCCFWFLDIRLKSSANGVVIMDVFPFLSFSASFSLLSVIKYPCLSLDSLMYSISGLKTIKKMFLSRGHLEKLPLRTQTLQFPSLLF